jgi:hypothetical protein
MLRGLAVLLLFQLLGEVLSHLLALPVPGPVVGMVLLLLALELRLPQREGLRSTASGLLGVLSILFVPAGVGIVQHVGHGPERAGHLGAGPAAHARPPAVRAGLPGINELRRGAHTLFKAADNNAATL